MKATVLTATRRTGGDPVTVYVTARHYTKRRQAALLLGSALLAMMGDGGKVVQEETEIDETGERHTPDPRR